MLLLSVFFGPTSLLPVSWYQLQSNSDNRDRSSDDDPISSRVTFTYPYVVVHTISVD